MKKIDFAIEFSVLVLAIIALAVAIIQGNTASRSGGVWYLICLYWIVLTVKNILDYIKSQR